MNIQRNLQDYILSSSQTGVDPRKIPVDYLDLRPSVSAKLSLARNHAAPMENSSYLGSEQEFGWQLATPNVRTLSFCGLNETQRTFHEKGMKDLWTCHALFTHAACVSNLNCIHLVKVQNLTNLLSLSLLNIT